MAEISSAPPAAGPDEAASGIPPRWRWALAFLLAGGAAALTFLPPADWLIGSYTTDLSQQFLAWRAFAADSLRAGHLPLWNPYTYAGQPFLAGFQSGLLYPPNLIFLVLPLCRAVNLCWALHLVILGAGAHRLARQRGLGSAAALVAGCLLPLSGAVFPHLFAGHLSNLCSMAWTPWILAGLEAGWRRGRRSSLLLAAAAVAWQIFGGQVQYVFFTAVAAGLAALAATAFEPALRRRALPALAAVYGGAALLAAGQLFPGLAAAGEGVRHAQLDYAFVSVFSFPWENLLTLFAPGLFGDLAGHLYWGRDYLWEMSIFAGVSGLVLAWVAVADPARRRAVSLDLGLAAVLLLLAFGRQTPLFSLLYHFVPGFDRFRGMSKFTFPAMIFFVMAVAGGADALLSGRLRSRLPGWAALAAGAAAAIAGTALWLKPDAIVRAFHGVQRTGESELPAAVFADPGFIHAAGLQAEHALWQAGGIFLLAGACLLGARRQPWLRWVLGAILAGEMLFFAQAHFATFRQPEAMPKVLRDFTALHPGDYRVLDALCVNNGYLLGAPDIWGNDPALLRRYAEFMTSTQGGDPDRATQVVFFHSFPRIYSLLRLRYSFAPSAAGVDWVEYGGAMSRVQLVSDCRVLPGRDAILAALNRPDFDPRRTVLLESEPVPRPEPGGNPGTVRVLEARPDSLAIEADVVRPSLLLITDPYSRDWHVRSLVGDARYQLLPADYILRGIPLPAGHHLLRLEYMPAWFRTGMAVSVVAWLLWIAAMIRWRRSFSWANRPLPSVGPGGDRAGLPEN